jgi:hypothetical protein
VETVAWMNTWLRLEGWSRDKSGAASAANSTCSLRPLWPKASTPLQPICFSLSLSLSCSRYGSFSFMWPRVLEYKRGRFQVLAAVSVETTVFWDMTPYSLVNSYRYFEITYIFRWSWRLLRGVGTYLTKVAASPSSTERAEAGTPTIVIEVSVVSLSPVSFHSTCSVSILSIVE